VDENGSEERENSLDSTMLTIMEGAGKNVIERVRVHHGNEGLIDVYAKKYG
jgi:hypothetical protein